MNNSTNYDVKVRYTVDGRAARNGTSGLINDTKELDRAAGSAMGTFAKLGAMAAGAFSIEHATKAFIGFNSQVQNSKIGLSAMLEGTRGGSWDQATDNADRLYSEFQKFSTLTPVTTQQIMEFGNGVAVATFQAGGSMRDFTDITEQGVIAAKSFGKETHEMSFALSEMMQGNARKQNSTVQLMLGLMKMDAIAFNALSAGDRLKSIKGVLNSDAFKQAAKAFGDSWSGVTSTLEDKLQILGGKIGLPLFKLMTKEVQSWSAWLDAHEGAVEHFAKTLGNGLADGFHVVKSALSFLVDHADLLLMIGKTWAAVKIGGMVGGLIGKSAVGIGTMLAPIREQMAYKPDELTAWSKKYRGGAVAEMLGGNERPGTLNRGNIAGALPAVGMAAAGGYAIGTAINNVTGMSDKIAAGLEEIRPRLDSMSQRFYQLEASSKAYQDELDRQTLKHETGFAGTTYSTQLSATIAKYKADVNAFDDARREYMKNGVTGGDYADKMKAFEARGVSAKDIERERADVTRLSIGQVVTTALAGSMYMSGMDTLNATQKANLDVARVQQETMAYMARTMDLNHGDVFQRNVDKSVEIAIMAANGAGNIGKMSEKPKVNVTIQRIEVQSDDPDRFAFGLVESFRDAVKNPSSALAALREG